MPKPIPKDAIVHKVTYHYFSRSKYADKPTRCGKVLYYLKTVGETYSPKWDIVNCNPCLELKK